MTGWRSGAELWNFSSRAMWRGFDPREGRTEEIFLFYIRVHYTAEGLLALEVSKFSHNIRLCSQFDLVLDPASAASSIRFWQ